MNAGQAPRGYSVILITGGTGYIGSHTFVALAQAGYNALILDNQSNSHPAVLDRLEHICGVRPEFIKGDIRDGALLDEIFRQYPISAVVHFAGLKAVGESVSNPLEYYSTNVNGSLSLLDAMRRASINTFIFSSSASVYGEATSMPIKEDAPRSATSPYGRSKLMVEDILEDLFHAEPGWNIGRLRYFNPVGAHESGLMGEDPSEIPSNLMPYLTQVAIGRREKLSVFGSDYSTADGTGVRDFIHVMDLAEGHVSALDYLLKSGGLLTANLGTGRGYSVLELMKAVEVASARSIPFEMVDRRPGDIAECWSDPSYAERILGWKATRGLEQMCEDNWRWQQHNPDGYR